MFNKFKKWPWFQNNDYFYLMNKFWSWWTFFEVDDQFFYSRTFFLEKIVELFLFKWTILIWRIFSKNDEQLSNLMNIFSIWWTLFKPMNRIKFDDFF